MNSKHGELKEESSFLRIFIETFLAIMENDPLIIFTL